MKKFTKICLIASLIMILVGGTICVIGTVSGGWRMVDEIGHNSRWGRMADHFAYAYGWSGIGGKITREIIGDMGDDIAHDISEEISSSVADISDDINNTWDEDWDDGYDWEEWEENWDFGHTSKHGTDITADYTDTGLNTGEIKDMEISIGGAALYFRESDNDNFGVKIDGKGTYKYYASNGVFYLEGSKRRGYVNSLNNEKVYLYIPKEAAFKEVDISVGGGIVELGELTADEVDLNAGAGIITSSRIDCRSLGLEVGAGSAELKGINTEELDLNVGVGNAVVEGNVSREIDAECGVGYIELKLANAEEDYNYELNSSAGSIELGGKSYSGLGKKKYINNNAAGECSLEAAMGGIFVTFSGEF